MNNSELINSIPKHLPETGYVRPKFIQDFFSFSKSTLWRLVKKGDFPQPIKLGEKITVFKAEDVHAWINEKGA